MKLQYFFKHSTAKSNLSQLFKQDKLPSPTELLKRKNEASQNQQSTNASLSNDILNIALSALFRLDPFANKIKSLDRTKILLFCAYINRIYINNSNKQINVALINNGQTLFEYLKDHLAFQSEYIFELIKMYPNLDPDLSKQVNTHLFSDDELAAINMTDTDILKFAGTKKEFSTYLMTQCSHLYALSNNTVRLFCTDYNRDNFSKINMLFTYCDSSSDLFNHLRSKPGFLNDYITALFCKGILGYPQEMLDQKKEDMRYQKLQTVSQKSEESNLTLSSLAILDSLSAKIKSLSKDRITLYCDLINKKYKNSPYKQIAASAINDGQALFEIIQGKLSFQYEYLIELIKLYPDLDYELSEKIINNPLIADDLTILSIAEQYINQYINSKYRSILFQTQCDHLCTLNDRVRAEFINKFNETISDNYQQYIPHYNTSLELFDCLSNHPGFMDNYMKVLFSQGILSYPNELLNYAKEMMLKQKSITGNVENHISYRN